MSIRTSLFLAYARPDEDIARQVAIALRVEGHEVFLDRSDLPQGESYNKRIRDAVERADGFVFLISPQSVAEGSYARTELEFAEAKWPNPSGHVLAVMTRPTDPREIPPYLRALTFVETAGNLAAKVAAEIESWQKMGQFEESFPAAGGSRGAVQMGKLAAAFGLFFFLQAFGYAKGLGTQTPRNLMEAVGHGFTHLSHIFLPWAPQAWPLAPTLCGLLILYAVYLPSELRRGNRRGLLVNRCFFSLLVAVTITTQGAFLFQFSFETGGSPMGFMIARLTYLALVCLYTVVAYFLLRYPVAKLSSRPWNDPPWPEVVAPASIAWLLLMSVLGSQFDGSLDAGLLGPNRSG